MAGRVGGGTRTALARVARTAFMSGNKLSLAVGPVIALGGALLVLVRLPARIPLQAPGPSTDTTEASAAVGGGAA
ncbi:MAG: hypothetical protein WAV54_09895 [Acidimicrobiales bacterium]